MLYVGGPETTGHLWEGTSLASSIRKLRKLRRDPVLFVKDMMIKGLGGAPAGGPPGKSTYQISTSDFEIVDGLVVIDRADLVDGMLRLKASNSRASITVAWRTRG